MTVLTGPVFSGLGGDAFQDWIAAVHAAGGGATAWPFSTGIYKQFYGRPAAKFDLAGYIAAYNSNLLAGMHAAPQQMTVDGQTAYVLANDAVAAAAPHVLTTVERAENAVLTAGDSVADTLHLPSLASIEGLLKSVGEDALIVVALGGLAWYLLARRR